MNKKRNPTLKIIFSLIPYGIAAIAFGTGVLILFNWIILTQCISKDGLIIIKDFKTNEYRIDYNVRGSNAIRVQLNERLGQLSKFPQIVHFDDNPNPTTDLIYPPKFVKIKDNLTNDDAKKIVEYFGEDCVFSNQAYNYNTWAKFRVDFFRGNIPFFVEVLEVPIKTEKE